jgi:hypothetical protein
MIAFAWIWILAATTRVDLVNEVYQIPPKEWRYVELGLNQRPARVSARYEVQTGSREVRVALMRREDLDRLREGLPHGVIDETETAATGSLSRRVRGPGDYVLVVDNRGEAASGVHLWVSLDFAVGRGPEVTRLPRERQLTVILISFAVFFGIVTWSAHRLLRNIQR